IPSTGRIPEFLARAFRLAVSGRPGPVVLGLPEDVQAGRCAVPDAPAVVAAEAPPPDLARLRERLAAAERPLLVVGGGGWAQRACAESAACAASHGLPACVTSVRQDHFDSGHAQYAGDLAFGLDPGRRRALGEADLLLAVGTRLGYLATGGYAEVASPRPRQ